MSRVLSSILLLVGVGFGCERPSALSPSDSPVLEGPARPTRSNPARCNYPRSGVGVDYDVPPYCPPPVVEKFDRGGHETGPGGD